MLTPLSPHLLPTIPHRVFTHRASVSHRFPLLPLSSLFSHENYPFFASSSLHLLPTFFGYLRSFISLPDLLFSLTPPPFLFVPRDPAFLGHLCPSFFLLLILTADVNLADRTASLSPGFSLLRSPCQTASHSLRGQLVINLYHQSRR